MSKLISILFDRDSTGNFQIKDNLFYQKYDREYKIDFLKSVKSIIQENMKKKLIDVTDGTKAIVAIDKSLKLE